MITIKEVIQKSEKYLLEKGISSPRREAEEVIGLSLLKPRLELYMEFDKPLKELELQKIRENLKRRAQKEPIQYIEGKVSFYNCELFVDPRVLIPRQETEILVDKVCEKLALLPLEEKVLWDICTGSGAIAIAIKKRFPSLTVYASDVSLEALNLAQKNAEHNGVEILFQKGNLFEPFLEKQCDYLISNPPYVSNKDYELLEDEVKLHEPKISLTAEKNGLDMYMKLAKDLKKYLKPGGRAFFEMGYDQSLAIKQIFKSEGFDKTHFEKDFSSVNRFFFLEIE